MRNVGQPLPDHAAILATLGRSIALDPAAAQSATVPPGAVVRVTGTAQPGPQGMLSAPLSGRPCVWFRVLEVRHSRFGPVDWSSVGAPSPVIAKVLASDMAYTGAGHTDNESPAWFTVAGPAGDAVLVDPVRADVSTPVVSADSAEGEWRFTEYVLRREWLLEAGTPVFVLGAVARTGSEPVLRATPGDCAVVSALGEAMVVARAQSTLAFTSSRGSGIGSGRGLVIGLTAVAVALLVVLAVVLVLR